MHSHTQKHNLTGRLVKSLAESNWTYTEHPSKEEEARRLAAVRKNGISIVGIPLPSEAVQIAAVQQHGAVLIFLRNPSEAVQLAAVQQDGRMIRAIEDPSEAVQLAAARQNGQAIGLIKNPSPALWADTKVKDNAIRYILTTFRNTPPDGSNGWTEVVLQILNHLYKHNCPWPELDAIKRSIESLNKRQIGEAMDLNTATEAEQIAAVQADGKAIRKIIDPSEAVQLAALGDYAKEIQYIENPTEAVQMAAVKRYSRSIQWIENPTETVKILAASDGAPLDKIPYPTEAVKLAAVKYHGDNIRFVENPSNDVQRAAIAHYPLAILRIKKLSPAVWYDKAVQNNMMTMLLRLIKEENYKPLIKVVDYLIKNKCPWPDFDVIKRSIQTGTGR